MNPRNKQSIQIVRKRLRTQLRYSALVTMTMRLLKRFGWYGQSKKIAQIAQIKTQKNFAIIVFRISILYRKLIDLRNYSCQKAIQQIFQYFKNNLEDLLKQKLMKKSQQNSELLLQATIALNQKDIQVFEKVLSTGVTDYQFVQQILQELYEKNDKGNFCEEQISSLRNLTNIFFDFANPQQNVVEMNQIVPDSVFNPINNFENQGESIEEKMQILEEKDKKETNIDKEESIFIQNQWLIQEKSFDWFDIL